MGEIRVKLYGALSLVPLIWEDKQRLKDGVRLRIVEPICVRDILEHFDIKEDHVHIAFVGKMRVMTGTLLQDGDTLHIFPKMAGG